MFHPLLAIITQHSQHNKATIAYTSLQTYRPPNESSKYSWREKRKIELSLLMGCGGPQGCETLRLPDFLDSWLTNGTEAVRIMHRLAALYRQEDLWCSFLLEAESTPGP
jgi:hypothetical protein